MINPPHTPHQRFVFYDADMVFPYPSRYNSSETYSMIFEAELGPLRKLVNQWLTEPTGGVVAYEPALPIVVATMAFYDSAYIVEEPFAGRGKYSYSEWIFRIFVRRKHPGIHCHNLFEPTYALVPFIFVSQPAPMVTGRQVFGMPKAIGDVEIHYPERFDLNATAAASFDEQAPSEFKPHHLVEIVGQDEGAGVEPMPDTIFKEILEVERYLIQQLRQHTYLYQAFTPGQMLQVAGLLVHMHHKRFISLRQIRDFQNPDRARYKALLEYMAENIEIRSVAPIFGDFVINFPDKTASFPLSECLGIQDGQHAIAGYKLDWSFEFRPGEEIWNANRSKASNVIAANLGWIRDFF